MALKPKTAAAPKAPVADPVNGEQADALEGLRQDDAQDAVGASAAAPGPDTGELEERATEAEDRAQAAERRADTLEHEMQILKDQLAQLLRSQRQARAAAPRQTDTVDHEALQADSDVPLFNEDEPYGLVVGDTEAAYVQDGHQFGKDKVFLQTEVHRGSPRAFNPRLVGFTKPRPGQSSLDALEGIRGRD